TNRTRWAGLAAGAALLVSVAVGTGAPAFAAPVGAAPATATATAATATATEPEAELPPLDPAAIRTALGQRPAADVTGAFVRVTGSAGGFQGASGIGDLATGQAVDPDGRFRIGSISKVFTTAVVLQLAGQGRLDLDEAVQHYLPGVLPAGFPPVTVGELLNHTSGLPTGSDEMWGDGSTAWFAAHRLDSWTPQQVVATLDGQSMSFEPGTAQQYNGMNTFLAGMVIERVTGHSYAHEVQNRIIRPLGLHDTSVPDADNVRLLHPSSHAYLAVTTPDGDTLPRQSTGGTSLADVTEQSPWPWAEGGLISSAPDLDRFISALFKGRLLPPSVQEELFTVPDLPNDRNDSCGKGPTSRACMSMGLERVEKDGVVAWGKTGSRPGYTSGVFATRDLRRKAVYSLNPTGVVGAESPYASRLLITAFGLTGQAHSKVS
ncbi:serine hydrolase domain-containing protein, partial [Saccharothrix sp. ST-888]|uniref:serine hydrolase domain-containing protein n=1 Tax=Saccharothrix sp. ST-888 TaxID=1427391 RepID=UPI000AB75A1E